jgi:hypothetical protein
LIIWFANSIGQTLPDIFILKTGIFRDYEIVVADDEEWIGLFYEQDSSELRRVSVLKKDPPRVYPHNQSGVFVDVDEQQKPIILISSSMEIELGPVPTVFMGWRIAFWEPDTFQFNFNEYSYEFRVSMRKSSRPDQLDYVNRNKDFVIEIFENFQGLNQRLLYLENCCNNKYPNLIWAGDIDRDNKLDFIYDRSGHYSVTDLRLCLSSFAEPGDLYKEVAQFRSSMGN